MLSCRMPLVGVVCFCVIIVMGMGMVKEQGGEERRGACWVMGVGVGVGVGVVRDSGSGSGGGS